MKTTKKPVTVPDVHEIRALRLKGMSIKAIASKIHKSDRFVSAAVKGMKCAAAAEKIAKPSPVCKADKAVKAKVAPKKAAKAPVKLNSKAKAKAKRR